VSRKRDHRNRDHHIDSLAPAADMADSAPRGRRLPWRLVALALLVGPWLARACTPSTNNAVGCSASGSAIVWECPTAGTSARVYARVRSPGLNEVDVDFTDGVDCNAANSATYDYYGDYSIYMSTSTLSSSRAITGLAWSSSRVCMWVWCTGSSSGFVYYDVVIDASATTYPANPNPSGVRTCDAALAGPTQGAGASNQVGVQSCLEAGYYRYGKATGLPSGSSARWSLSNPVGHYFQAFLFQGSSCDALCSGCSPTLTSLPALQSITGGSAGYSEQTSATLTGTATAGTVCWAMACKNNVYYDGACATMTMDWVVTTPAPSATGTPASTGTGTPASTGTGTPASTGTGTPASTGTGTSASTGTGTSASTGSATVAPAGSASSSPIPPSIAPLSPSGSATFVPPSPSGTPDSTASTTLGATPSNTAASTVSASGSRSPGAIDVSAANGGGNSGSNASSMSIIIAVACGGGALVLVLALAVVYYRRRAAQHAKAILTGGGGGVHYPPGMYYGPQPPPGAAPAGGMYYGAPSYPAKSAYGAAFPTGSGPDANVPGDATTFGVVNPAQGPALTIRRTNA
jgi:hypothetical protein